MKDEKMYLLFPCDFQRLCLTMHANQFVQWNIYIYKCIV